MQRTVEGELPLIFVCVAYEKKYLWVLYALYEDFLQPLRETSIILIGMFFFF